ncbi:hypothetical protein [Nostoc sp.]
MRNLNYGDWGLGDKGTREITMPNDGSCFKSGNPPNAQPPQYPMPNAQ